MARRKPKAESAKPRVIYDDGVNHVEYVSRPESEINTEILRAVAAIRLAKRHLLQHVRSPNPIVRATLFIIDNINPDTSSHDPKELARISFLMDDALSTLNKMRHTGADHIRLARFQLLYGQTPKRRDRAAILTGGGRKDRDDEPFRDEDVDEEQA